VMADGSVVGAGENVLGQLGLGYSGGPPSRAWYPVPGLTGVVHVRRASGATCAIGRDGSLWCWGGGLFDGIDVTIPGSAACDGGGWSTTHVTRGDRSQYWCQLLPRRVEGLPGPVEDVAFAGTANLLDYRAAACALLRDHTVWCFGINDQGQIGDGRWEGDEICTAPGGDPPARWPCRRSPRQAAHMDRARLLGGSGRGASFWVVRDDDTIWRWGVGPASPTVPTPEYFPWDADPATP
jgi:hypothetical protein